MTMVELQILFWKILNIFPCLQEVKKLLYSIFTKPGTRSENCPIVAIDAANSPLRKIVNQGIASEWVAGLVNEIVAIIFVKKAVF